MAKKLEKPITLKDRVLACIKHSNGQMPITVVVKPEEEAQAKAMFKRLGKRAGKVTYRVRGVRDAPM